MVGGELLGPDFHGGAVEADVADVVLSAAVGAAAHVDVDALRERVFDAHGLDPGLDGGIEAHGACDAQFAAIRARAGDDVGDAARAGIGEAKLFEALPHFVEALIAHPAQDDVLLDGRAGEAAAVFAHDGSEATELLGLEVAASDLHFDRSDALLALCLVVGGYDEGVLAAVAVWLVVMRTALR